MLLTFILSLRLNVSCHLHFNSKASFKLDCVFGPMPYFLFGLTLSEGGLTVTVSRRLDVDN